MMNRLARITAAACLALALAGPAWAEALRLEPDATVEPLFVPGADVTARVVEMIGQARQSISVQAYGLTSRPIAQALIEAHQRGVEVAVIADRAASDDRGSLCAHLAQAGVPVYLDGAHKIAHNKVMIMDGQTVLTGSFNWTASAQRANAENLLIVRSGELASRYLANWQRHREHAEAWRAGQ